MYNSKDKFHESLLCVSFVGKNDEGDERHGTGVLFHTYNEIYDLVITAGHCTTNILPNSVEFQNIDLHVVSIIYPEKYKEATCWDFSVIVIKKIPNEVEAFDLSVDYDVDISKKYKLCGYPEVKRETDCTLYKPEAEYIKMTDDNQLIFKINTSLNSFNFSEKELLEGMSGGPIIDTEENPKVAGIFTHTTVPDGAYKEICAVKLEMIIEWMNKIGLIYFIDGNKEKPCILESYIYPPKQNQEGESISAILLGKSGAGKSAFAKTFIKNSDMFESTGQTRTTRSTIKYKIHLLCQEPKISIQFFNKEDFVKFRLKRCYEILESNHKKELKSDEDLNKEQNNKKSRSFSSYNLSYAHLVKCTLSNDSFFDYQELTYLDDSIQTDIIEAYNTVFGNKKGFVDTLFSKEEYRSIFINLKLTSPSEDFIDNENDEEKKYKNEYNLDDLVSLLFEKIYEIIKKCINSRYELNINQVDININDNMNSISKELVNYSLKVYDRDGKKFSLTGFVKEITIEDRVSDEYVRIFKKNNLITLTLIDTYGLDHAVQITPETLEQRLWEISKENKNVDYIFFIRKLGSDAPSDLECIIPNIYSADSRFRVYTIFTAIDTNSILSEELFNDKKKILHLLKINEKQNIPAVKYFIEDDNKLVTIPHPIISALVESNVSEPLSRNIYQDICDHLVPYCAKENIEDRKAYITNNIYHIDKLLYSLINKEYLGKGLINIKYLEKAFLQGCEKQNVKEKLMELLKTMFIKASLHWYRGISECGNWRTQQANINCLQKGKLGYSGTYNHEWDERFFKSYNYAFSKLSEYDFNILFSTAEGLHEAVAIQQLINKFGRVLLGCPAGKSYLIFPLRDETCNGCNIKDCFRSILLQAYISGELRENVGTSRVDWLEKRCDFGERFDKIKDKIYTLFLKEFNRTLVPEAKSHNARKVSDLLMKKEDISESLSTTKNVINELLEGKEEYISNKRLGEIIREIK